MLLRVSLPALAVGAVALVGLSAQGLAQTSVMKECGAQWQAAKAANTVPAGQTWNQFLKDCRAKLSPEPAAAAGTASPAGASPAAAASAAPSAGAKPTAAAPAAAGSAVFPASVSGKYSSETPARARMHTCLDQYKANKATNGNGGLNWIQKGGGYYSACNKRLKG